ncbi:MAG: glycosyltransferase [Acidobacteriaceae bacterium]|nr:glycosyltransferase [Acidobacteriaceae bacterium]MBV9782130.1 glycosyltransferase [Acidobacteriaceae bacterium]
MRRKILHVVGGMTRGGVETWLMHVLRSIDRGKFDFHFLVHTAKECAYDKEIYRLGAKIHRSTSVHNPVKYAREFKNLMRGHGPFDVVHSHVFLYSGFLMRLAQEASVPIRISHSHTAPKQKRSSIARRGYERLMRRWLLEYSTARLGVSAGAAEALFGKNAGKPLTVLPYGLDFRPFMDSNGGDDVRTRFGIPSTRKVIGHVGRFVPVKNHAFIAEVFERVIQSEVDAHLLLIGDGDLLGDVQADIESRRLSDRCTFAGLQSDVAPFLSAMDVFVFPSFHEGTPLSILEAEAAGIPIVVSPAVPSEMDVVPDLVRRIPLEEGAAAWTAAVIERLENRRVRTGAEARLLERSRFGMPACIETLSRMYLGEKMGDLAA